MFISPIVWDAYASYTWKPVAQLYPSERTIYCPASLQRICLDQICDLLREGAWRSCAINPFSNIPSKVANELMDFIQSHHNKNPPKIRDVAPLLTSGRLTRFNLCPFNLKLEHDLIIKAIYSTGSVTLQDLDSYSESLVAFYHIRKIISQNPNLKELHLNIQPDFEIFRNCQNLEILRFYSPPKLFRIDYFFIDLSVLSSLKNLVVLHIPDMDSNTMASVLDVCPNLISLGLADSLDAMVKIFQRMENKTLLNFGINKHFQLKRCVWGKNMKNMKRNISDGRSRWCKSRKEYLFSVKLKHAIIFCPLVEELILHVLHKNSFKALKILKKLTLLRLDFKGCIHNFVPSFIELLQNIGPQLKHLSIICNRPVPVDVICACCPHLQSLEIEGPTFVKDSTVACSELPLLRLRLSTYNKADDKKSFLFLLSNCKHLLELFLKDVKFLNDTLLKRIFDINPLKKLKVSCIEMCNLSFVGYRMFKKLRSPIEVVDIDSNLGVFFYDITSLYQDPNIFYKEDFDVRTEEFFYRKLSEKRF